MADLLEESYAFREVRRGDILTGTIVHISPTEILVDVGCKSEGIVSGREMERVPREDLAGMEVGDQVPVYVLRPEDEDEGHIPLSLSRAWVERDWEKAQELYESGDVHEGSVVSYNKGGLIVPFGQVRGFVPVSQLESSRGIARSGGEEQWSHLVGEHMTLKIIEVDRRRNRLILSERAAKQERRKEQKERLLNSLQEGTVITGRVTSLADFGAFVDLGGADGLVHLSELSWAPVRHPKDVLDVGQEVEVYVLQVDIERQRISLSIKRLQPEPWSQVFDNYEIDQMVDVKITRLATFGAFAQLDEIEGLIHISELTDRNITHPREVLSEGDAVKVKIIHIDPERRRMGLSLKQAEGEADWQEYAEAETDAEDAQDETDDVEVEVEEPVAVVAEETANDSDPDQ
jgi:small subunit ribosomal protein S1